ncbi:PREDICTED: ER membrane protein complex subunit 7 homolog [Drosophila arizonae]|uniref:ER membrane protein complex subunit 7 homolog n=1 Tax=Drosophila arizonae TaxID=7263 RepID=A0ABM1NPB4_DROAR|nr:PREDICTED: ER membrane protein complex subunit 7 homolog [Drosophila arizonae]
MSKMLNKFVIILMVSTLASNRVTAARAPAPAAGPALYTIEGSILPLDPAVRVPERWPADVSLALNGGEYLGFVQADGSFRISGVPSGSYVLYAHHADIFFQPIRIDIAHNGKFRARKLSHLRPSQVVKLPYPLMLKPGMPRRYFRTREQWNILDYMLNPMVLLMVFPKIPTGVPDLSDMITSFLTGNRPVEKEKKPTGGGSSRKRN